MRSIATDWQSFARSDMSLPAEMLDGIRAHTADAWVTVEPQVEDGGRGLFRRKPAKSAYSATVSPYADDEHPHFVLYLSFPNGPRFRARCTTLPSGIEVDDESADDAMLRAPMSAPTVDTMRFVLDALEACSDQPLGSTWRAAIGDTAVPRSY